MLVRSTARVGENIVYECGSAVREFDVGADERSHDELAKVRRGNALQVDAGGAFALDNCFVNEGIADRAVIFAARREQILPGVNLCDQCSDENNVHGRSPQYGAQSPRRAARNEGCDEIEQASNTRARRTRRDFQQVFAPRAAPGIAPYSDQFV